MASNLSINGYIHMREVYLQKHLKSDPSILKMNKQTTFDSTFAHTRKQCNCNN